MAHDTKPFTVRLPAPLLGALDAYASFLDLSRNEAIARAVEHYLAYKPDAIARNPLVREFIEGLIRDHQEEEEGP